MTYTVYLLNRTADKIKKTMSS